MATPISPKNTTVNKVVVNGETWIDLSSDTVTESTLQKGITAHRRDGAKITGSLVVPKIQTSKSVTITANGTTTISPDSGYSGLGKANVTVNVPSSGSSLPSTIVTLNVDTNDVDSFSEGDVFVLYVDPENLDELANMDIYGTAQFDVLSSGYFSICSGYEFELVKYETYGGQTYFKKPSGSNIAECCICLGITDVGDFLEIGIKLHKTPKEDGPVWINPD